MLRRPWGELRFVSLLCNSVIHEPRRWKGSIFPTEKAVVKCDETKFVMRSAFSALCHVVVADDLRMSCLWATENVTKAPEASFFFVLERSLLFHKNEAGRRGDKTLWLPSFCEMSTFH